MTRGRARPALARPALPDCPQGEFPGHAGAPNPYRAAGILRCGIGGGMDR